MNDGQMKRAQPSSVVSHQMVWGVPVACDRRTREIGHIFPDRRPQPVRNAKSAWLLNSVGARHFTGRNKGPRRHLHRMLRCHNASQKAPCCLAKWDDKATNHVRLHEKTAVTRLMCRSLMTASPASCWRPLCDTKWTAEACRDRDLETSATLSFCL